MKRCSKVTSRPRSASRRRRDIAQSILERGFDKAVIITDGYASMSDDLKQQLRKRGLVTLTILFDDAQTCDDFAEFGEVVQLGDVTAN